MIKGRWFFLYGALLLLLANSAYAARYQRTKEGTLVWNNLRGWGDEATWSGERDPKRYAVGEGTLTWYRVEKRVLTGSNIPFARGSRVVVGTYSGKMVRGKFDGLVVSVNANEKTFHATFADGRKVNDWAAGPAAPGPSSPRDESVRPADRTAMASDQRGDEQVRRTIVAKAEAEPPPPAAGPAAVPHQQANKPVSGVAAQKTPSQDADDSIKSLIGPPSFLRMKARAEASSQATRPPPTAGSSQAPVPPTPLPSSSATGPRLTAANAIELADAEAQRQGFTLDEYQRPQADYSAADETWSVSYDQTSADGVGKHLSISVEDKTKKTSIAAGR